MRHLISLKEQSKNDLLDILELAQKVKRNRTKWAEKEPLKGRTLIMLFQKTSTRTRLSFEAAMTELGGHAIFLDSRTSQFSLTEFKDEINAVMRFGNILMFRANKAKDVELAAKMNVIPVIDACSEKYHPCQALGDILTMIEKAGGLKKIKKIAWIGIENNVSNTLRLACAKLGVKMVILSPEVNEPSIDKTLNEMADKSGLITYYKKVSDFKKALTEVDFIHTDTWMDMEFFENGQIKNKYKKEYQRRKKVLGPYQLNAELVDNFCPDAKIMHCMPCHIGYEITRDAVDHNNSVIFDQAENRLHIQKAIILWLLGYKNIR